MRILIIILFILSLIAFTARAQEGIKYAGDKIVNEAQSQVGSFNSEQDSRRFAIVEIFDKVPPMDSFLVTSLVTSVKYITDGSLTYQTLPPDTAFLFISTDGRPLKGATKWEYSDQQYDTTFTLKEIIDDASTTSTRWGLTNIAKATNSAKPDVYNKSFTYVQVVSTASSQKIVTTCDRVEFYSEKAQGHGYVKILVDGQQVAMIFQGSAPYNTDFKRGIPSWYYNFTKKTPTSPAGEHTIEFITDAGNQYILDFLKTFTYTLKPR